MRLLVYGVGTRESRTIYIAESRHAFDRIRVAGADGGIFAYCIDAAPSVCWSSAVRTEHDDDRARSEEMT